MQQQNTIDLPIVLLGGTGDVGQILARRLRRTHETQIILASRNPSRASGWAPRIFAETMRIDTTEANEAAQLPSPAIIVNLTEATSPAFIEACLSSGTTILDTSASEAYFEQLTSLGNAAISGTIIPQTGLMPGLTNLFAASLNAGAANIKGMKVFSELGLGRHYGQAATQWVLENMGGITGSKRLNVRFPGEDFAVLSILFPFSDSPAIKTETEIDWAESYISLAPQGVTRLLSLALRLGIGSFIARHSRNFTAALLRAPSFGAATTRVMVVGYNKQGIEIARMGFSGSDQAELTAFCIEQVLNQLPKQLPVGLVPITQVTTAEHVMAKLVLAFPDIILEGFSGRLSLYRDAHTCM